MPPVNSISKHAATLAALDAKATHMPSTNDSAPSSARSAKGDAGKDTDDSITLTIPEVIDMYNSLQELRRKAGLPLSNVSTLALHFGASCNCYLYCSEK